MDREKNWGVQPNEVVLDRLPRLLQQQLVQVDLTVLKDHEDHAVLAVDRLVHQLCTEAGHRPQTLRVQSPSVQREWQKIRLNSKICIKNELSDYVNSFSPAQVEAPLILPSYSQ